MTREEAQAAVAPFVELVDERYSAVHHKHCFALLGSWVFEAMKKDRTCGVGPRADYVYSWNLESYLIGYRPPKFVPYVGEWII